MTGERPDPFAGISGIPDPDEADWSDIREFALAFNGYGYWGSSEECARIANSGRMETMAELRTCLFFEQRRWRHVGESPDAASMKRIRDLLRRIGAMAWAEDGPDRP